MNVLRAIGTTLIVFLIDISGFLMFLVVLGLIVLAVCLIGIHFDRVSCQDAGAMTGHATAYSWRSGCYVRVGDEWMPWDRFTNVRLVSP